MPSCMGIAPYSTSTPRALNIPVTKEFHAYGTPELAQSALDIVDHINSFFILKDHGFVALGKDIDYCRETDIGLFF